MGDGLEMMATFRTWLYQPPYTMPLHSTNEICFFVNLTDPSRNSRRELAPLFQTTTNRFLACFRFAT